MEHVNYDFELKRVIGMIRKENAKIVCIQLPDGLKPKAKEIVDKIRSETSAKVLIWLGSCYGACDIPVGLEKISADLVVSWGHNAFVKAGRW